LQRINLLNLNLSGKLNNPFKKISDTSALLVVILVQVCLISFVFDKIIFQGTQYVFSGGYDGAKNYFTLQGYVQQQPTDACLKFGLMNYPYGDFIYYTDNTPLIALLERVVLNDMLHQSAQAIWYFNLFILAGIILSSLILYKLFRQFSIGILFAILLSVFLPWLCPQIMRLGGHFNLTLSFIPLLIIYLLAKRNNNSAGLLRNDILLVLVILLSGFVHLYFLLLALVFVFSFFFFSALNDVRMNHPWMPGFIRGGILCIAALVLFYSMLQLTDDYYGLRRKAAEGYNFDDWKLHLRAFYTPYFFHPLSTLFSGEPLPYESFGYLGSGTLIGIAGVLLFLLTRFRNFKSHILQIRANPSFRIILLLLLASLPGVLIALGENVHIAGDFSVTNYLNPFFYLRKIVPQVTHFRCLARFSWYFFWCANLFVFYFVVALYSRKYFKILLALMLIGFFADTFYSVKYSTTAYETPNPFNQIALEKTAESFGTINTTEYQALLTFPFYHVGSEDYNYTIDPEDNYCIKTMQLSLATGLPLINSKMSRTPLQHTYNIFSLFETSINDSLLNQLNDKPILVYLDKSFYDNDTLLIDRTPVVGQMPAKDFLRHGHEIIRKYGMENLKETDKYAWYKWTLLN